MLAIDRMWPCLFKSTAIAKVYGTEYTLTENLERLRKRGLGRKQSLAMRESALGLEALERFVSKEPLRRVH